MLADSASFVKSGMASLRIVGASFTRNMGSEQPYPKELRCLHVQRPGAVAAAPTMAPCGEVIERQFSSCWKCGAVRETAAP